MSARAISNIVYIHTHDSGRHIEPYGFPVPTPRLMELASGSVTLRQCFSGAPSCSPSRASLLTGMYPHSCGMIGLAHRGFSLKDNSLHVSHILRRLGFETVLAGIQHEAARATDLAYDRVISSDTREMDRFQELDPRQYDLDNAEAAAAYLGTAKKPFFMSFGMFSTHREFPKPAEPSKANYVAPPPDLNDGPESRLDMLAYMESATVADTCVGIVMDALKRSGLEESTLVLFTTDHGIAFPHRKSTLYDGGIGVACMLKYPGNPLAGAVLDPQVSQIDILPTIFELLGLPPQAQFQGMSLVPLLEGKTAEGRAEVVAESTWHAAYEPMRCLRTERYKYIRRFDLEHRFPVPANTDDCPEKDFLIARGILGHEVPLEELYDLDLDPLEGDNLVGEPSRARALEEHRSRLDSWMRETEDPLLKGPVPMPKGAFANRRTCVSPSTPDFEYGT
jgi:arylsulfatase A-like enzyme